jgi:hypothetical protein
MAKNKTTETNESVADYLAAISDGKRRNDFSAIVTLITKETKFEPKMWGSSIVGFGSYHYQYESGREGDAPLVGIACRANAITFYLGNVDSNKELLSKFGKHKAGKGCIHIKKLEDINLVILSGLIKNAWITEKNFITVDSNK